MKVKTSLKNRKHIPYIHFIKNTSLDRSQNGFAQIFHRTCLIHLQKEMDYVNCEIISLQLAFFSLSRLMPHTNLLEKKFMDFNEVRNLISMFILMGHFHV